MRISDLSTEKVIEMKERCEKVIKLTADSDELVKASYYEEYVIYKFATDELNKRGVC